MPESSDDKKPMSAVERAQFEAQQIAFGPIMFQAVRILRDSGILAGVRAARAAGITIDELESKVEMSRYACIVLLEAGLSANVVSLEGDRWRLTKTGFFILEDPLTRVNMDFNQHVCYQAMMHLEESLREGKPVGLKVFGDWPTLYEGLSEMPAIARDTWLAFDHYYSDESFSQALPVVLASRPERILDVGGNTGKFAIYCASNTTGIEIVMVDLPKTLARARDNAEAAGVADRIQMRPTDLLDPEASLPTGADVLWMSQFLCCFSEEEVVSILRRAREVMAEGTRLLIMDTFWDRQRYPASTYCLHATSLYFTCLANGNSRMYDTRTMKKCVELAGLRVTQEHDDIGLVHTILECKR